MNKTKAVVVFLFIAFISACSPQPEEYRESLFVFGTVVDITLLDVNQQRAQQAIKDIETDLNYLHSAWHPWRSGAMSRTNALLSYNEWFSGNPSVLPLITRAKQLYTQSHGLFNPAIGKLIGLWGFHSDDIFDAAVPEQAEINAIINNLPTMDHIEVDGFRLRGTHPGINLDMGAFAKGVAVDRVIAYLQQAGIHNAIVNAGGDLKAIGSHGDRPWRVGIRHPRKDSVIAGLDVFDNESVFTSGDYERNFESDGKRYHHIIDPRTGYPADQSQSVTVIHQDAGLADAAATALFIAGPQQWQEIAKSMGIKLVMLVDKDGNVHMTKAMQQRLAFTIKPQHVNVVE